MNLRTALPALTFAFLLASVASVACSSSSSSSSSPKAEDVSGSCAVLASRCHPVQTTLGKECHELGHDGDDAKCAPRRSECLAECPETTDEHPSMPDGAAPVDAAGEDAADAGPDATADAAPGPCAAYCTCMAATCASESSYPFADEAACLTSCAAFGASDRTCFANHCEDAKTANDKGHDCEHASGTVACH